MNNKNKVIIITRNEDAYKALYEKTKTTALEISESILFPYYDSICDKIQGFPTDAGAKLLEYFKTLGIEDYEGAPLQKVAYKFVEWGEEKIDANNPPNMKIQYDFNFDGGIERFLTEIGEGRKISYYYRFENEQNIVTLFYFDRTLRKKVDRLSQFLFVICKDCDIDLLDLQTQEDNLLYIHDDEWGVRGNRLILEEHKIKDAGPDKTTLLRALQTKFSFVAAFQHVNEYGSFFRDILDCRFGNNPVALKLGELEEKHKNFEELLEDCKMNLEKA